MRKYSWLLLFLCSVTQVKAQQKADTLPKRDSILIEETTDNILDNIPVVSLDENDMGDGGQGVSSVLTVGRDPYFSAASFNFSAARFKLRGYDNDHFGTYMNGIPMDNLDNGFTPYGLWGGLNDVMRRRDITYGLKNNNFSFGDIGSNVQIDTRAFRQRAQTSIGYANSNRSYNHRWTLTHSSGMSKKGWAWSLSGSRRWAGEGYVPGTYYDGWSYYAALDKRLGKKQMLSLVVFGAPTENGRQGAAVQELVDLSGDHYYNPNWGYQNGKKRNASVGKTNQPIAILTHDFKISPVTSLITAAAYSFGDRSISGFDWYNAPDPRPDYYRYLPSYTGKWASTTDQAQAAQLEELMRTDEKYRQVNWQHLYDVNRDSYETIKDANGVAGNNVSGRRSRYILENRVINTQRLNFNTVLNTKLSKHVDLTFGASYQHQKNHYYKKVQDLLGGEFYVDLNQFAERDFRGNDSARQNNLNAPNRILHVGDKFGYDYDININKAATFVQGDFKFRGIEFFAAANYSRTNFYRNGNTRNGLYPNNSFGKSKDNVFNNYGVKGGITYQINARNYVYANGAYITRAPYFENVYISPRTRNTEQDNVTSEEIKTAEGGYLFTSPALRVRLGGYYTRFSNGMDVMTFFHDSLQSLVNYSLSGIDKLHFGGELGIEWRVVQGWTINAAAAVGRYYYDSKQKATITADNSDSVLGNQVVYAQNFRIPSTPQEAYNLGVTYRSRNYWFVSLTGNYFDQAYLSFNPIRRTYDALKGVENGGSEYHRIFDQTKFKGQYTLDFFGGWSIKLPRKLSINKKTTFLALNVGVSNLLNNKNIITGGYEQLRYDAKTGPDDKVMLDKFPPKFFYAYGANYFASATLRF